MPVNIQQLVKECILEVLKENLGTTPSFILVGTDTREVAMRSDKPTIEQAFEDVENHFADEAEYEGDSGLLASVKTKYPDAWVISSGTSSFILYDENSNSKTVRKLKSNLQNKTTKPSPSGNINTMHGWKIVSLQNDITVMREKDQAYFVIAQEKNGKWQLTSSDIFVRIMRFGVPEPIISRVKIKLKKVGLAEGFDPQSAAGPNPASCEQTQNDPYKAWNAKMRKMEEDVNYGNSGTTSKSQLHHQLVDIDTELALIYSYVKHGKSRTGSFVEDQNNIAVLKAKKQEILQLLKRPTTESGDHGREAQQAGAGQFDPRTFGVNEAEKPENLIYKQILNGKDVYWIENETGGTTALSATGIAGLIRQGYKIVELDAAPDTK